jgi:hypothetical protein
MPRHLTNLIILWLAEFCVYGAALLLLEQKPVFLLYYPVVACITYGGYGILVYLWERWRPWWSRLLACIGIAFLAQVIISEVLAILVLFIAEGPIAYPWVTYVAIFFVSFLFFWVSFPFALLTYLLLSWQRTARA